MIKPEQMAPNSHSGKIIILSDFHIGGDKDMEDFECADELTAFLDHYEKENENVELIILGDFFDLWRYDWHFEDKITSIVHRWKNLFDRIKKFGEKNKITLIPGNHDHELVYNKKYQKELSEYNIHVDADQYFKREIQYGGKSFCIIGEHGNQVEPGSAFPDFNMPTESSLAYHIHELFVRNFMRGGPNDKKKPAWLKGIDNVDVELIPYWLLSKYFYHEIGPVLRIIMVPMLLLFSLAIPFFIFDVATHYYQPKFLIPFLDFLHTNLFMKALIFILYFDMAIVIILFILSCFRKDFYKRLQTYGVQSLTEIVVSKYKAFTNKAAKVFAGENPYNKKADMYVAGHTHNAEIKQNPATKQISVDVGSWKQLMKSVRAYFNMPPVFYPYFLLTYLVCYSENNKIKIQLRAWPKNFDPILTMLETISIKKQRYAPRPILKDTVIKEITVL